MEEEEEVEEEEEEEEEEVEEEEDDEEGGVSVVASMSMPLRETRRIGSVTTCTWLCVRAGYHREEKSMRLQPHSSVGVTLSRSCRSEIILRMYLWKCRTGAQKGSKLHKGCIYCVSCLMGQDGERGEKGRIQFIIKDSMCTCGV